jgi:hypothetical protein
VTPEAEDRASAVGPGVEPGLGVEEGRGDDAGRDVGLGVAALYEEELLREGWALRVQVLRPETRKRVAKNRRTQSRTQRKGCLFRRGFAAAAYGTARSPRSFSFQARMAASVWKITPQQGQTAVSNPGSTDRLPAQLGQRAAEVRLGLFIFPPPQMKRSGGAMPPDISLL